MLDTGAPIIDVSPYLEGSASGKNEVAEQVGKAFETYGFMIVVGHGIARETVEGIRSQSRAFFDLPTETKRQVLSVPPNGQFCGYVPFATDAAGRLSDKDAPADLRERFRVVCSDAPDIRAKVGPEQWPVGPAGFAAAWTDYYRAVESLANSLIRVCALALELPERYFDPYFERHFSVLAAMHSPPITRAPEPGQLRCGAHTDHGMMTLVNQRSSVGGLQIFVEDQWVDLEPVQDSFAVNIGDLLARWTNDRWVSTMHRVVNTSRDFEDGSRRLSLVYFNQPNLDAEIACLESCTGPNDPPKYEPITLEEHFAAQQKKGTIHQRAAS